MELVPNETESKLTGYLFFQVTKNERQIMKPLYDRYRLVKQILCRASTIPVIVSIRSLSHLPPPPPLQPGSPRRPDAHGDVILGSHWL